MKVWRLVSGILSIVFAVFVLGQSMLVSVGEAIAETETVDGSAGLLVAILMLAGGIVSIVVHKSYSKGSGIALLLIFGLAGLAGLGNSSVYGDLIVWGGWCLICAVLALLSMLRKRQ